MSKGNGRARGLMAAIKSVRFGAGVVRLGKFILCACASFMNILMTITGSINYNDNNLQFDLGKVRVGWLIAFGRFKTKILQKGDEILSSL